MFGPILAGAMCLTFLHLERFESFKGAGFEAKMKEVVSSAYATLDEVRELARTSVMTNVDVLTWLGRWGSIPLRERIGRIEEYRGICRRLNIDDTLVNHHISIFYRMTTWDYVHRIADAFRYNNLYESINTQIHRDSDVFPDPHKLRKVAESLPEASRQKANERIDDYEYFLRHRVPRENESSDA